MSFKTCEQKRMLRIHSDGYTFQKVLAFIETSFLDKIFVTMRFVDDNRGKENFCKT